MPAVKVPVPSSLVMSFFVWMLCDGTRTRGRGVPAAARVKIEGADKDLKQAIEEGLRCAALASQEQAATSSWLAGAP